MNIIELAKEAGFDLSVDEYNGNLEVDCEGVYYTEVLERFAALVRAEALAEQFRDATKMVAEPVKQDTPYCKSAPMCAKPCGDESCVEPVKQEEAKLPVEPVAWNIKRNRPAYCSDDPTEVVALLTVNPEPIGRLLNDGTLMTYPGKMVHLGDDLYAAPVKPVKQEPVAYMVKAHDSVQRFAVRADVADEFACKWRETDPDADFYPLYAAPVDAKAIREQALEEAAKVCDDESRYSNDAECCAAAIRGLK